MPPLERSSLHQTAVLWPYSGTDAYGEVTVDSDYIEIPVRWENRRREVLSPEGTPIAVDAMVFVDRDIAIGSLMWLGEAEDLVGTGGPGDVGNGLMQVVFFDSIPDIKGRQMEREVGLIRYRKGMPTQT